LKLTSTKLKGVTFQKMVLFRMTEYSNYVSWRYNGS
jgi:hypothetical protein